MSAHKPEGLSRRDLFKGVAVVGAIATVESLAGCKLVGESGSAQAAPVPETAAPATKGVESTAPATTIAPSTKETAKADVLKVRALGLATPDKVATLKTEAELIEAYTLRTGYATDEGSVIASRVWLDTQYWMAGTTTAEIQAQTGGADVYLAAVAQRYDKPAVIARYGSVPPVNGMPARHAAIAARAYSMQGYDHKGYVVNTEPKDIKIISGSYGSGKFTAQYSVILTDNIDGTRAAKNDPKRNYSVAGRDQYVSTFTSDGGRWLTSTTKAEYIPA